VISTSNINVRDMSFLLLTLLSVLLLLLLSVLLLLPL
jgi:hypothetical protein